MLDKKIAFQSIHKSKLGKHPFSQVSNLRDQ